MSLGPYASFIVTSYTLVAAVVVILIVWIAHRLSPPEGAPARTRGQRHDPALRPHRDGYLMSAPATSDAPPRRRRWLVTLPLIGFMAVAGLFLLRLYGGDPSKIPSALIGRPAPQTALPALEGLVHNGAPVPGLDPAAFKGKVSVVNVWASWCVPCHDEAPLLTALAKDTRLQIVGINYKDSPDNARRFLGRYGNPFSMVGVDGNGRGSIEWGVYGVPETFVVGRDGTIRLQVGRAGDAGQSRQRAEGRDREGVEAGTNVVCHSGAMRSDRTMVRNCASGESRSFRVRSLRVAPECTEDAIK